MGELLHENSKGVKIIREDYKKRSQVKVFSSTKGNDTSITHIVLTEFGKTLIFHSAPGQIWIAAVDGLMMANILILPYRRGKSCMLVGTNISEHRIGGVLRAPQ